MQELVPTASFIPASTQLSIAGLFYLLSKKIDFKRKDLVPYSEMREKEREQAKERLKMLLETAPPVTDDTSEEIVSKEI